MLRKLIPLSLALVAMSAHRSDGAESKWIRLRAANFEMYSSASPRSARDTIQEFEQVRGFFIQAFGEPPGKPLPVRLVAFSSAKEFEPYRMNEVAIAYYLQTTDRDYIVMSHSGADTFPIAVHEYVHLLVRRFGLKLPPWLNEGMAELYSTLRPMGDKVMVGALIPGRQQALLQEKWVPLETILAANRDSPYYNEKSKAGSLYNEGWALTHMLCLNAQYRSKFGELLHRISTGEESAAALQSVYGRPVAQIDKDLQAYLRGTSFQGAFFQAKIEKATGEIPVEPLADFDAGLMFADLMYRPGKEVATKAALEQLVREDPKRPEPYRGLAYLALRAVQREEATKLFGQAYERGDRDAQLLWDYGRLLEGSNGEQAIHVLSELLLQDAERSDVRLELAETQFRASQSQAALDTLAPMHGIAAADAPRYFRIKVYAYLSKGDRQSAAESAKRFLELAKTEEDRAAAEQMVSLTQTRDARVESAEPATGTEGETPELRRRPAPAVESKQEVLPPVRPSLSGRFVELQCQGKQARMIIETDQGRKVFLIDDGAKVTTAGDRPVDMACGKQKTPVKVEVGYDRPPTGQAGLEGIVRTLAF